MDQMDTLPMPEDDMMSPINRMAALSLESPQTGKVQPGQDGKDLVGDDDVEAESAEEEDKTSDEEVHVLETVALHSDICIDILSEDESILSPQKPSAKVLDPAASVNDGASQQDPCASAGSTEGKKDPCESTEIEEKPKNIEEILDSDEDKPEDSARGVFKVGALGLACMHV